VKELEKDLNATRSELALLRHEHDSQSEALTGRVAELESDLGDARQRLQTASEELSTLRPECFELRAQVDRQLVRLGVAETSAQEAREAAESAVRESVALRDNLLLYALTTTMLFSFLSVF